MGASHSGYDTILGYPVRRLGGREEEESKMSLLCLPARLTVYPWGREEGALLGTRLAVYPCSCWHQFLNLNVTCATLKRPFDSHWQIAVSRGR